MKPPRPVRDDAPRPPWRPGDRFALAGLLFLSGCSTPQSRFHRGYERMTRELSEPVRVLDWEMAGALTALRDHVTHEYERANRDPRKKRAARAPLPDEWENAGW